MTKPQAKFGMENPFIPSRSAICRAADTALMFAVAALGFGAVVAVVCRQLSGAMGW